MAGSHSIQSSVEGIHTPFHFIFADATERTAYVPIATDVGKFAWQTDNNGVWFLSDLTPTWIELASSGSFAALTDPPMSRSIKTADFNAEPDKYYIVRPVVSGVTITLPLVPSAGDSFVVEISPVDNAEKVEINPNTNSVLGILSNIVINGPHSTFTFTYDGTKWVIFSQFGGAIKVSAVTSLAVFHGGQYLIDTNELTGNLTVYLPTSYLATGTTIVFHMVDLSLHDFIVDGNGNNIGGVATVTYDSTDPNTTITLFWLESSNEWRII